MAKDLDFKRRSSSAKKPTPLPTKPVEPALITPPPVRKSLPSGSRTAWIGKLLVVLTLLLLVGIVTYLYYESLQTTSQAPAVTAQATNSTATTQLRNEDIVVKVYDGGAGSSAVEEVIKTLKEHSYQVENGGKNLTEYEQTQIWYTTGYEEKAVSIASLIGQTSDNLRKSQFEGMFALQIFLGKQ